MGLLLFVNGHLVDLFAENGWSERWKYQTYSAAQAPVSHPPTGIFVFISILSSRPSSSSLATPNHKYHPINFWLKLLISPSWLCVTENRFRTHPQSFSIAPLNFATSLWTQAACNSSQMSSNSLRYFRDWSTDVALRLSQETSRYGDGTKYAIRYGHQRQLHKIPLTSHIWPSWIRRGGASVPSHQN